MKVLITIAWLTTSLLAIAQPGDKEILLQRTLNLPFIQKALDEEGHVIDYETVILKSDLIPNEITLTENEKPVRILDKATLKQEKTERYREYTKIVITGHSAEIRFIPHGGGVKGSLWFEKVDDTWLVKKIKITQNYKTIVWKEGQKKQTLRKTRSAVK